MIHMWTIISVIPGFRYFPVVGVTWRQAVELLCKWRTAVVNLKLAEEAGLLDGNSSADDDIFAGAEGA